MEMVTKILAMLQAKFHWFDKLPHTIWQVMDPDTALEFLRSVKNIESNCIDVLELHHIYVGVAPGYEMTVTNGQ